jgi:preprotein translocase subunit SecD
MAAAVHCPGMSRIILPVSILLGCALISACSSASKLHYSLSIPAKTPSQVINLINASERMVKRRLSALGVQNPNVIAVPKGDDAGEMTIEVPDATILPRVQSILSEQFTFDMRLELKETTPQDQNVEANWEKLGIQNEHLVGVQVVTDEKSQEVAVELLFTDDGRALLGKAFNKNKGKTVGIFVRNLLVSKLKITSGEISEHVVISGIPSAAVAQIFADDVNVGLHVAFRPIEK